MVRLLGLVISVGLADSMNPSTIAPALFLATGEHARRDLVRFTLGAVGVYLIGGELIVIGPGEALLALVPDPDTLTRYILETIAGVVVLAGGAALLRARERLSNRSLPAPKGQHGALLLGISIMGVELPTALPYFAVIAAVVGSGLGLVNRLILVVIYNLCFGLPLLLILLTVVLAGERATAILGRGRDFLDRRWPLVLAVLLLAAGVFVTLIGVTGIIGRGHGAAARLSRHLRHFITHG